MSTDVDRVQAQDPSEPRPGPLAWTMIAAGWALVVVAVLGAFVDDHLGGRGSWVVWVVGGALVHDLVVLPLVVGAGWLLTRWVPPPWRGPLRTAAVVAAVVSLTVWPIARRWGARADNPSILPLPVGRNLALLVAAILVVAIGVGAASAWRHKTPTDSKESSP